MRYLLLFSMISGMAVQAAAQNVGIGTLTPAARLQVAGNVIIDSGLRVSARNVSLPLLVEGGPVNQLTDQQSLQYNNSSLSNLPAWQSFTAGVSGTLVQVDLFFSSLSIFPRDLIVYRGTGTAGTALQTIGLGITQGWVSVTGFSVPLVAGETYTLALSQESWWGYSNSDAYSRGISSNGLSSDFVFRTVMNGVNDPLLNIQENGNIGIGVSLPAEKLDVRGHIKASGNLIAGEGLVATGGISAGGDLQLAGNLNITGQISVSNRIALPLVNAWTNYGESYGNATYYIDKFSVVRLSGLVKNGTGSLIAQLPPAFRPATDLIFTVVSGTGFARLDIKASGNVQLMGSYSNAYVSLDGVTFRVN